MGTTQSKLEQSSYPQATFPATSMPDLDKSDWGEPPSQVLADEKTEDDLVLLTVANCKAKPMPAHLRRSDNQEQARRKMLSWRKRTSFIELDCGDDSFFVSNTYKTIGIADGVGGWAEHGVDSSHFSNELMRCAKLYSETHRNIFDPGRILANGFAKVLQEAKVKAGGSTALLASLVEDPASQTGWFLDVANLGDSGCIIVRNRDVVHRFHEKSHTFNCPFQLSILPPGMADSAYCDAPSSALRERYPVKENDVIVLGTDGLFDNRFSTQIASQAGYLGSGAQPRVLSSVPVIGPILDSIFEVAGPTASSLRYVDPYRVVERIVADAYKVSMMKKGVTPWVMALKDLGVEGADGGKVDDITCVLARVVRREELHRTTLW